MGGGRGFISIIGWTELILTGSEPTTQCTLPDSGPGICHTTSSARHVMQTDTDKHWAHASSSKVPDLQSSVVWGSGVQPNTTLINLSGLSVRSALHCTVSDHSAQKRTLTLSSAVPAHKQRHSSYLLQKWPPLPAGSESKASDGDAAQQDAQLQMGSMVVLSRQGTVKGYSRTQVKVVFTPPAPGPVREEVSIAFR